MLDFLVVIQARIGSTRFPNKVMQTVGGVPMVKRVWNAAHFRWFDKTFKVIVAWPERYPDLDENDVISRFRRIGQEFPSQRVIRLTADCPLLTTMDIKNAIFDASPYEYYNNRIDGHDVQIFDWDFMYRNDATDKEHVIKDIPNTGGLSVNTKKDLEKVRAICATR